MTHIGQDMHVLDSPVRAALWGRQAGLSVGGSVARRFAPAIGPLAAVRGDGPDAGAVLAGLVEPGGEIWFLEREPPVFSNLRVLRARDCVQMVAREGAGEEPAGVFRALGADDAEAMLELATLTQPGPFGRETWRLGGFIGVFEGGRLVAMAGERLAPDGFAEVSGVCTHPDMRGRGLAKMLMRSVMMRIAARGAVAFLHCYADQAETIGFYRRMGFVERAVVRAVVMAA